MQGFQHISHEVEGSITALVINSNEKQVSALYNGAKGG